MVKFNRKQGGTAIDPVLQRFLGEQNCIQAPTATKMLNFQPTPWWKNNKSFWSCREISTPFCLWPDSLCLVFINPLNSFIFTVHHFALNPIYFHCIKYTNLQGNSESWTEDPDHPKSLILSIYNLSAVPKTHRSHPFAKTLWYLWNNFNDFHKYKCLSNIKIGVDIHKHKGHDSDFQTPSWNYCPCFDYHAKYFSNPVIIIIMVMMMKKYHWSQQS